MRKWMCAIVCLCVWCAAMLGQDEYKRGDVIEKDGVEYWVASWYRMAGRMCGEAIVMGVTSDGGDVVIPRIVRTGNEPPKKSSEEERRSTDLLLNPESTLNQNGNYLRVVAVNDYAFKGRKLKSLKLPALLDYIGKGAFEDLELGSGYLYIPRVEWVGQDAFVGLRATLIFLAPTTASYRRSYAIQSGRSPNDLIYAPKFDKTFSSAERQPETYIPNHFFNLCRKSLPLDELYTYGEKQMYKMLARGGMVLTNEDWRDMESDRFWYSYLIRDDVFFKIGLTSANNYERFGDARDRFAPKQYNVYNLKSARKSSKKT